MNTAYKNMKGITDDLIREAKNAKPAPKIEHDETICPDCGGNLFERFSANGPDDYDTYAECEGCGSTFTS